MAAKKEESTPSIPETGSVQIVGPHGSKVVWACHVAKLLKKKDADGNPMFKMQDMSWQDDMEPVERTWVKKSAPKKAPKKSGGTAK